MQPLNNWTYFTRNLRRVIPSLLIVVLAVVGISVISVVSTSQYASTAAAWLDPFEYFAIVQTTEGIMDPQIVADLEARPDIHRVVPYQWQQTWASSLMGRVNANVLGLSQPELEWFMQTNNLQLMQGRLPDPGKREVIMPERMMRGRDLTLGDEIGVEVDEREFFRGRWTIVGMFDGPIEVALAPEDSMRALTPLKDIPGEASYLVFPKEGQMASVDAYLRDLPKSKVNVFTYESMSRIFQIEFDSAKLVIWTIDIVTITVLAIATGLLNTIYFLQRMSEYGVLAATGYRRRFLVRRALSEAMTLTAVAWVLGLALAQGLTMLANMLIFNPRGYGLESLNAQSVYYTLPIPILIAIFSFYTVIRSLRRLDPVAIVERRD